MAILSPFLLFALLTVLLYLPPVQGWAVQKAASYASEATGMDISIDRVAIGFPLDVDLEGFKMLQPGKSLAQSRDTVADVGSLAVEVKLWPLFGKKVVINALDLRNTKFDTSDFVPSARVKGRLKRLFLSTKDIDLDEETVDVSNVLLADAQVDVALRDTVISDTSTTKAKWKIDVSRIEVKNTAVSVKMPGDTLSISTGMSQLTVTDVQADLFEESYRVGNLEWNGGRLAYDNNFEPRVKGLDYNHISLTDIRIALDSVLYKAQLTQLKVRSCALKEQSGIAISDISTSLRLDSTEIDLPSLRLRTPDSDLEAELRMGLNLMDNRNPGKVYLRLKAYLGKQDIMLFAGSMPQQFVHSYPNRSLSVICSMNGTLKHMDVTGLDMSLPTAFQMSAKGWAENVTDIDRLNADVSFNGSTGNLGFVTRLLPSSVAKTFRIPQGMGIKGNAQANGSCYSADITVSEGKGTLHAEGNIDTKSMAYKANVDIRDVQVRHFMPRDSIGKVSGSVSATGCGFDFTDTKSRMNLDLNVATIEYGSWAADRLKAKAVLKDGVGHAEIDSHNRILDGVVNLDALLRNKTVQATLNTNISNLDLHSLRMAVSPLTIGLYSHLYFASDLKQEYKLQGQVSDLTVATKEKTFRPKSLVMDVFTGRDTTWAKVSSGSLQLDLEAQGGYESLMNQGQVLLKEMEAHYRNKIIDQTKLKTLLPTAKLSFVCGDDNPLANFLRMKGIVFDNVNVDLSTSPADGLNGKAFVHSLIADRTRLDTVTFCMKQDSASLHFNGKVQNNNNNPQFVFTALFDGEILNKGAAVSVRYLDADNKLGVSLGAKAEMVDSGVSVHLEPYHPILGYTKFNLNEDNYIFFGRDRRVQAKVDLVSDEGTGVKVSSENQDADMLQDITVSLNKFDLSKITSVMPYAPRITGLLNGDFRLLQDKNERISVLSDLQVGSMTYERCPIGDLSSELVYLQKDSASHFIEAKLNQNGKDVGTVKGTYYGSNGGSIDATATLTRLPLSIVNGFIPDKLFGLDGYTDGEMTVKGPVASPQINGELYLDSASLISVPYGLHMRMDDDPVRIVGNNLLLENFTLYSHNDNPLNIYGNIDFSDMAAMKMSLRMRADNYLLIDAEKTTKSVTYGKAYVNFLGYVKGAVDNLQMRGKLDVLGSTGVTYILKDSPLSTDDQLKGLVTFTDFRDSTRQAGTERPALSGLDMQLMVNIESGARINCALNANESNYVDVEGGGELRMVYSEMDGLQLYGRYTINDGEMKYALPVIPLKTFKIGQGSYVEFRGDMMNPTLNLTASEQVKSLVSSDGGASRSVKFDCGVKVTKTLQDMGLEFTLDAPEDLSMKNELAAMSVEQRGKLAVSMLTTGMYLSEGNSGGVSMNNALNSFLQSEINNIASSAMRTVDLSVGMDQNSDGTGNTYTDYSFKFAKRLWNNRVNIVIGGKLSGANKTTTTTQDNTFIDNVSLEYRLDQSAMRYVRLFYNKEAQDILEDRISEYGGGFVWRKKIDKLSELFTFGKSDKMPAIQSKQDSTKRSEVNNKAQ